MRFYFLCGKFTIKEGETRGPGEKKLGYVEFLLTLRLENTLYIGSQSAKNIKQTQEKG